jgi:hypothetical protein
MTLFNRKVRLRVGTVEVNGLDVRFNIRRSLSSTPNKAEVQIWNLNKAHREELEQAGKAAVTLEVGYEDDPLGMFQIFGGRLREVFSVWDPPDWVTKMSSGDGDNAMGSKISQSYRTGTSFFQIWRDTVNAVGVGVGNAIDKFAESASFTDALQELGASAVLRGNAMDRLQEQAKSAGLELSIQDGVLQVTEAGKPVDPSAISVVLGPRTGLISSPMRGNKGELRVRSLIVPGIEPGRGIQLEGSLVRGVYRVETATYKGDTASNDWYADLELKAFR